MPAWICRAFTSTANLVYHDKFTRVIGPTGDPKELSDGTEVKVLCNAVDDGSYLSNKIIVHGYNDDGPRGIGQDQGRGHGSHARGRSHHRLLG